MSMNFDDLIQSYRGLLREKYDKLDRALEAFRVEFPGVVSAAGLPLPSVVPRAGSGSASDIVSVAWVQDSAQPGAIARVRIDWTVSISAFHFSVRDPRDPRAPQFDEAASMNFKVPQWFIDRAQQLMSDKALPYDRWEAKIYTY